MQLFSLQMYENRRAGLKATTWNTIMTIGKMSECRWHNMNRHHRKNVIFMNNTVKITLWRMNCQECNLKAKAMLLEKEQRGGKQGRKNKEEKSWWRSKAERGREEGREQEERTAERGGGGGEVEKVFYCNTVILLPLLHHPDSLTLPPSHTSVH